MFSQFSALLTKYYKNTYMKSAYGSFPGVVTDDFVEEKLKKEGTVKVRTILLYQKGKKDLLKINAPLDYVRDTKNKTEIFTGDMYFGSFKGSDFATLKVVKQ